MTMLKRSGAIATMKAKGYWAFMIVPRMLKVLTILAVLLMPLGMLGAAPAAAMGHRSPAATASDHCAAMGHDQKNQKKHPGQTADCMIACAAIPVETARFDHDPAFPLEAQPAALTPASRGLHPKAATPPPRLS